MKEIFETGSAANERNKKPRRKRRLKRRDRSELE